MASNTTALQKKIFKALKAKGITVSVQRSITTSSIYLKLDNGALRSIRIGDHAGRKQYHYGYEIGSHIHRRHEFYGTFNGTTFTRIKFPAEEVDALILEILLERSNKKAKYSPELYAKYKKDGVGG